MTTTTECIATLIDYIELHLDEPLDLETLSNKMGYSKYHLHRMFTAIVGFPIHIYIQRRRLTEAARSLIFSETPILDIALSAGYETQRSFSTQFKQLFKCSPKSFRKRMRFLPLQLKFDVTKQAEKRDEHMFLEIQQIEAPTIYLIGYHHNTEKGFRGIGKCWHQLHAHKTQISNRNELDFLIGINDYTHYAFVEEEPAFDYYAACSVSSLQEIPKGMTTLTLPASHYVVFSFKGHNKDSMATISDYIYKEWFPHATCKLNEKACYDFIKYGENVNASGISPIEYWVPILPET